MQKKFLGKGNVDFDIIDQLLIRYSLFVRYWRKGLSKMRENINYLKILRSPVTQ